MSDQYLRLAAERPNSINEFELFIVPDGKQMVASLNICSQVDHNVDVWIAQTDEPRATQVQDYIFFNKTINPYRTFQISGLTLKENRTLRIQTSEPYTVSFVLHGLLSDIEDNYCFDHVFASRVSSTFETNLYTAPVNTQIIGLLNICNQHNDTVYINVAHSMGEAAALPEDWMLFNEEIPPYETMRLEGFPLGSGETIKARTSVADAVSFVYSGTVITSTI